MTEDEFDFCVVGTGAAGMTAALTAAAQGLRVVVLEKENTFGGSAARSGGGLWIPNNSVIAKAGIKDSPEQARVYLSQVVGPDIPPERQAALLEHGPEMLELVRELCPVDFAWVPGYSDYYPELKGGIPQGRTIEPIPLDGRVLGDELKRLTPPYLSSRGMTVTAADYRWLSLGTSNLKSVWTTIKVAIRSLTARMLGKRMLTMGQALAAGLRAGLARMDVPVLLGTPLTGLEVVDGRVVGVRSGDKVYRARLGVLLAAGGFERNEQMRLKYQQEPINAEWTVGAHANTGDAIEAGLQLGAALDLMEDAWWGPTIPLTGGPYFCLAERNLPGSLFVNGEAQRFVNEAAPYVDAVHAMYETGSVPAWMIFDQSYRNKYLFAGIPPRQPLPGRWYKSGVLFKAGTLSELAAQIGLDGGRLESTVARFNTFAETGHDEDFQRGESVYDRYYGDPGHKPNPSVGALAKAPYYAIRIVPGDLGTKGGLRTDEHARVLREDGSVIPGLYAAGNTSGAVMGHSYAGAGATLAPAMTFGYLAALHLSAQLPSQLSAEQKD